jgi:hypothetical protein
LLLDLTRRRKGPSPKIHGEAREALVALLEEDETIFLSEIADYLMEHFAIDVSVATVSKTLKEMGLTRKRLGLVVHRAQDEELRAQFRARMARDYSVDQLVTVDESATNERTSERKYGWSRRGVPCRASRVGRRSERWSVLPALTHDGILFYEVFHGSFDRERFEGFMRELVSKMSPFPALNSVILLDNASIHHNGRIEEICHDAGVVIEYLPPYSPDLNPTELVFHELKDWLRRNRDLAEDFEHWFEGIIHLAISCITSAATARGYFKKCGYGVIEDWE